MQGALVLEVRMQDLVLGLVLEVIRMQGMQGKTLLKRGQVYRVYRPRHAGITAEGSISCI